MEKIKLTFLGTGSAIPTARRNHPAVHLEYKNENILIDCGEGTQRQFRFAKLNPQKLTRILITHWHGDHVLGLPGLFQTLMLNKYNKTLKIYGPKNSKRMVDLFLNLFVGKGNRVKFEVIELGDDEVDCGEFYIKSRQMKHDIETNAYSFAIKEKIRLDKKKLKKLKIPDSPLLGELARGKTVSINGKKINPKSVSYIDPERKITFILDTLMNDNAVDIAKDSDLLVCESTYLKNEEELAKNHMHLITIQAGEIAKKSKSKKLILTHLSQRYETKEQQKKILDEVRKVFKNSELANDLMSVEV